MKLLLDTHIFLWCVKGDKQLSKKARTLIQHASEVYVSSASIWEAAIKTKIGKLDVEIEQLLQSILDSGFSELSITANHTAYIVELPDIHRDPFDRIMIAQAMVEPLKFLTADSLLQSYSDLVTLV